MKFILKLLSFPKSVVVTVLLYIWTFIWSALTIVGSMLFSGKGWGDFITRNWARGILTLVNIECEVSGEENFAEERGIFLFNHSSHFDIPILFWVLRSRSLRFGAKAELFKVPLFGKAMSSIGIIKIHRSHREEVLNLYKESLKNLETGINYTLAPEGTRQNGEELGKFKSGPFIMAITGQVPIYPVVLIGAHKILKKGHIFAAWGLWKCPVKFKILPAVPTKGLTLNDRPHLQESVREMMAKAFE